MATKPDPDFLLREYQELCNNMRHYGNARLARLTMLFALNGALLLILFGKTFVPPEPAYAVKIVGVILASLFWFVDIDVVFNWRCFRDRAIEVEAELGLQQYSIRKEKKLTTLRRLITETNATNALYILLIAFWCYALITF